MTAPGVIVVAEPVVHELLRNSGGQWNVQERQPNIAAMWQALSSGALDVKSRVLVFSDGLGDNGSDERAQTARAVVAMANAGASVFVVVWKPDDIDALRDAIAEAAAAQGLSEEALTYHLLPAQSGGRLLLDAMRAQTQEFVEFPDDWPPQCDIDLVQERRASVQAPGSNVPSLPPISGLPEPDPTGDVITSSGYPAAASMDLLSRPRLPGQVTITVTSSKGGSGKSTASMLLAATIARASREAGKPLSVCLVDLDTRDGQVASLIGRFMPTALNIRVQPVWDEERIRRNLVPAEDIGIDTLLAPIRPRTADTVGPEFYRVIVRSLQRMYDVVVIDTSVQYLDPLIADVALKEADEILFVTTLASTAVQGMARALREITAPVDESGLGIPREKIGIFVNQSLANVGMEREQILAAGLGVPVVGVIPLATKDVLTAMNLHRMHELVHHPLLGPAYNQLARACLPQAELAESYIEDGEDEVSAAPTLPTDPSGEESRKRSLFRRGT
jgi:cellulose biosynthesis protein BcsQ